VRTEPKPSLARTTKGIFFSETSAETISSEDCEEEEEFDRLWVVDARMSRTQLAEFIFTTIE
jgi:hypothetical protein